MWQIWQWGNLAFKKEDMKSKKSLPIARVVDNLVDSYQFDAEKIKMNKHSSIIFAKLSTN